MSKIFMISGIVFALSSQIQAQDLSDPTGLKAKTNAIENRVNTLEKTINNRLDLLEKEVLDVKRATKLVELPLNQPVVSKEELFNWATDTIVTIYSYNFINYQQVLASVKRYFTKDGYESYVKALKDSNNLKAVQDQKLTVSALVSDQPKILKEGVTDSIYIWEVQLPLLITYQNAHQPFQQNLDVTIEIVRVPYAQNKEGISIHSITAQISSKQPSTSNAKDISSKEKAGSGIVGIDQNKAISPETKEKGMPSTLPKELPKAPPTDRLK